MQKILGTLPVDFFRDLLCLKNLNVKVPKSTNLASKWNVKRNLVQTLFFLLLLGPLFGKSDDACKPAPSCCEEPKNFFCVYLPNAKRCSHCSQPSKYPCGGCETPCEKWGFFALLDFLYWQVKERGLEYALKNEAFAPNFDLKIVEPEFDWQVGWRFHLGAKIPHDDWDVSAVVTHFDTRSRNTDSESLDTPISPGGKGLIPVWVHAGSYIRGLDETRFGFASATWKFNANIGEVLLAREFCIGSHLAMKSFFGLKNAWLYQEYEVDYSSGNVVNSPDGQVQIIDGHIDLQNDSIGVGPEFGVETRWNISRSWSLFFHGGTSLLVTSFDLSRDEENHYDVQGNPRVDVIHFHDDYFSYKPQAEIALGLNYGWCLCRRNNQKTYIGISASYEAQYWWKQNQMIRFIDDTVIGKNINTQGDLLFHGLNVQLEINF